jgi:hypothetical protein
MFDAVSIQDVLMAAGLVVSLALGIIAGLLS